MKCAETAQEQRIYKGFLKSRHQRKRYWKTDCGR